MSECMHKKLKKALGPEKFMGLTAKEKNTLFSPQKVIGTDSLKSLM